MPETPVPRGKAVAVTRTARQEAALAKRAAAASLEAEKSALAARNLAAAQRLAQIVNLTIAGYSFEEIAASTGSTPDEIEQMITADTARFVRTQPALRVWARNWISKKYTGLLDAVYDEATDKTHPDKLEHSVQALRILKEMARLHGAEAPAQTEVKVDAAPEAVEKMVAALASAAGHGYDDSVFDAIDVEVLEDGSDRGLADAERAIDSGESAEGDF